MYPSHYRYTSDHQWVDVSSGRIGITHHCQQLLGDVVYVVLPHQGSRLVQGQPFSTIETCDAILELLAPVSGHVVAVNSSLNREPRAVNASPHDSWIVTVSVGTECEADLLDVTAYLRLVVGGTA